MWSYAFTMEDLITYCNFDIAGQCAAIIGLKTSDTCAHEFPHGFHALAPASITSRINRTSTCYYYSGLQFPLLDAVRYFCTKEHDVLMVAMLMELKSARCGTVHGPVKGRTLCRQWP